MHCVGIRILLLLRIIYVILYVYFVHTEYNIVYVYESYIGRTARNLRRTTYSIVVAMGRSPCSSVQVTRVKKEYELYCNL